MSPREPTPAELLSVFVPLGVAALAMVYAMVQWSTAMLGAEPPTTSRRTWLWGAVYVGLWVVLVALFLRLFLLADGGLRRGAVGWLALFVGGWGALHGLILWFGRALQRAQVRGVAAAREAEAEAEIEPATDEAEPEAEEVEPPVARRRARRKVPRLLRRAMGWAVMIALVLVAMVLGELPPLKALEAWMEPRETPLLAVVGTLAGLGFVLMMGGVIHLLLTAGQPMSHAEAEDLSRRTRDAAARPYTWRASTYRVRGKTVGAQAEGEASFAEIKAAWRAGTLWRTRRLRRIAVTGAGALLMMTGLFGIFVVVGPAWVKVLAGGAVVFALTMIVRGFRQA
ncbi:MAG: hypothetical protein HYV62_16305 [Candidatus Rokubacteria bacterium]|nr:hypothetical protein [Candidatus Rokubacteria bacterium]